MPTNGKLSALLKLDGKITSLHSNLWNQSYRITYSFSLSEQVLQICLHTEIEFLLRVYKCLRKSSSFFRDLFDFLNL